MSDSHPIEAKELGREKGSTSPGDGPSLSLSETLKVLADARRRTVVQYLESHSEPTVGLRELAESVTAGETDCHRSEIERTLHHQHLPLLADTALLEYDPEAHIVHFQGDEALEHLLDDVACDGGTPSSERFLDRALRTLADPVRRDLLFILEEHDQAWIEIDEAIAALTPREDAMTDDQLKAALFHVHLPELEDLGLVEVDWRSETIRYHETPVVTALLETIDSVGDRESE